jgi:hypothetical protein
LAGLATRQAFDFKPWAWNQKFNPEKIHQSPPPQYPNPVVMSRIEELPDDFDESLNLNERAESPSAPTQDVPAPEPIVAGPQEPETKTADEMFDMIKKTPLFMTNFDDAEGGTPDPHGGLVSPAPV